MTRHPAASWTPEQMADAEPDPSWAAEHRESPGWRPRHPRPPRPRLGPAGAHPDTNACALRPQPESVKVARDFAKTTLRSWGMVELLDDLGLVVSELVTNALRHAVARHYGGTSHRHDALPDPRMGDHPDHQRPIQLSLQRNGTQVVCAVTDPSDDIPVRREPDHIAETGRGLHLVECFSRAWGWTPLTGSGKVVWALFCPPR